MSLEQPRHRGMEELGLGSAELDDYLEGQGIAPPAELDLGAAAARQSVEPIFDSSDPDALQDALDTICVDRGD